MVAGFLTILRVGTPGLYQHGKTPGTFRNQNTGLMSLCHREDGQVKPGAVITLCVVLSAGFAGLAELVRQRFQDQFRIVFVIE
jgi:hypothetical protein